MTTNVDIEMVVESGRNVLRMRFHGNVTAAAMKAALAELESRLASVRPGFTVLSDLSDLESMELDCVDSLTRMMEAFKASGIGRVVRIIPDPAKDIGFNILSLTHYRRGVRVVTCETLAEAERALPAG